MREGNTIGSGTVTIATNFRRAILTSEAVTTGGPALIGASHRVLVTGTAGDEYNVRAMHWVESASGTVSVDHRNITVEPAW